MPPDNFQDTIYKHFSVNEIRQLCFDIGIEYDDIAYNERGKESVIAGLLQVCQRRGKLEKLRDACQKQRPNVGIDWLNIGLPIWMNEPSSELAQLVGKHERERECFGEMFDKIHLSGERKGLLVFSPDTAVNNALSRAFRTEAQSKPNTTVAVYRWSTPPEDQSPNLTGMIDALLEQLMPSLPNVRRATKEEMLSALLRGFKHGQGKNLLLILEDMHLAPDVIWQGWLPNLLRQAMRDLSAMVVLTVRADRVPPAHKQPPDNTLAHHMQFLVNEKLVAELWAQDEVALWDVEHYIGKADDAVSNALLECGSRTALGVQALWLDWREDGIVIQQNGAWVFAPGKREMASINAIQLALREVKQAMAQAQKHVGSEPDYDEAALHSLLNLAALEGDTFTSDVIAEFFREEHETNLDASNALRDFLDDWLSDTADGVRPIVREDERIPLAKGYFYPFHFEKAYHRMAFEEDMADALKHQDAGQLRMLIERLYGDARWRYDVAGKLERLCELEGNPAGAAQYANHRRELREMDSREHAVTFLRASLSQPPTDEEKRVLLNAILDLTGQMLYLPRVDVHHAISYAEEAENLADELNLGQAIEKAGAFWLHGWGLQILGKYNSALKYHNQALEIAEKLEWSRTGYTLKGNILNNISSFYYVQGDYATALDYLKKSLAIMQEIGDKAREGTTLNNISQIFKAQGDYATALDYLKKSLAIMQEIGDKAGEGATLNNISALYHAQGDYATALDYLKKSLAIRQEIGDRAGLCATLFNMGHIHARNNEIGEAVSAWVTVYMIAKQINEAPTLPSLSSPCAALGHARRSARLGSVGATSASA